MKAAVATIAAALCLFAQSASARLGETLEECIQRYGRPLDKPQPGQMVRFYKADIIIQVWFYEGRADRMLFAKKLENASRFERLSDAEVAVLMNTTSYGRKWVKSEVTSLNQMWNTEDGTMFAVRDIVEGTLLMATKENVARAAAAAKAVEEMKKLSGF